MPAQLSNKKLPVKGKVSLENASAILQLINSYLKWLLLLIVVGLLALSYWLFLGQKITSLYDKSQTFLPNRQQTLQDLNDLQGKLVELDQEYKSLQQSRAQDINRIFSVIPTQPDYASLFVQADILTRLNNLQLKGIDITQPLDTAAAQPQPTNPATGQPAEPLEVLPKNVRSLTVNIKIGAGDYAQIKALLSSFEKNLRLYDVQSISFESFDPDNKKFPGFQIMLKTYFRDTTKATNTAAGTTAQTQ